VICFSSFFCYITSHSYASTPKELNHISAKIRNVHQGSSRYLLICPQGSHHFCLDHEQFARNSYFHDAPGAPGLHLRQLFLVQTLQHDPRIYSAWCCLSGICKYCIVLQLKYDQSCNTIVCICFLFCCFVVLLFCCSDFAHFQNRITPPVALPNIKTL